MLDKRSRVVLQISQAPRTRHRPVTTRNHKVLGSALARWVKGKIDRCLIRDTVMSRVCIRSAYQIGSLVDSRVGEDWNKASQAFLTSIYWFDTRVVSRHAETCNGIFEFPEGCLRDMYPSQATPLIPPYAVLSAFDTGDGGRGATVDFTLVPKVAKVS